MNAGDEIRHAILVDQNALNHSFYRQRQEPPPAGLAELCDLIRRACKYHQHVMLAVDALDECKER